jgi:hypothetical protein
MIRRIEEAIDFCNNRDSLSRLSDLHDLVTCAHLAFLQNAEVEVGPLKWKPVNL